MDTYIFFLINNQSGSTLIHNLFAKCRNTITLNTDLERTTDEGWHWVKSSMPNIDIAENGKSYVWTENIQAIQDPKNYKWEDVKKTWHDMWRKHPNYNNRDRIFLEKSPGDVGRAKMLSEQFEQPWFICQVRNPYVVAEGVMRRRGDSDIRRAARHAANVLSVQKWNIENVENVLAWRYEDISIIPDKIESLINDSIPDINGFSFNQKFYASSLDGYLEKCFDNFNTKQLEHLDDRQIRIINEEIDAHEDAFKFFKYERIGK